MEKKKIQIGKILLEQMLITEEQLEKAMTEQNQSGKKLGQALVDLGFVDEDQLLQVLSNQMNIPLIDLRNYPINPEVTTILPEAEARRLHALVLSKDDNGYLVGMVDPLNLPALDDLERELQLPLRLAIVREGDLQKIIDVTYRHGSQIVDLSQELSAEMGHQDFDISELAAGLSYADAPVVKLIQYIFDDAAKVNASDVHIEPDEHVLRLRLRIDGVLHEQILKQKNIADALSLRLKIMAGLNIAEKRMPQDGRFSVKIHNKNYDVRLSTLPAQYGESVVMRLLNQSAELIKLDQIGMPKDILEKIRRVMTMPNGLLLMTGPTGSGKTTTLYGMLAELNTPNVKIITVEDPVEYRLARITQVQVQANIHLDFARVLRSILRQDPDIIMIGELRDQETAEIAMRASMTGHFVFSTLHTNDAVSSAERLVDMGVESYLVASTLRAIISQRLVRRICQNCRTDYTPTAQEKIWVSMMMGDHHDHISFKYGKGCSFCYQTGYKGQMGIFELLEMNQPLAEALRKHDTQEFNRIVKEDMHHQSLIDSAFQLVKEGITTISEVMYFSGDVLPEINAEIKEKKLDVEMVEAT